ncbi:hypothetical protein [Psychrobacter pygoscelis]|nr:hypothetical protein [Psychrobacter pygoscelis]
MTMLTQQKEVWLALSDLLIDNQASYEYTARRKQPIRIKAN